MRTTDLSHLQSLAAEGDPAATSAYGRALRRRMSFRVGQSVPWLEAWDVDEKADRHERERRVLTWRPGPYRCGVYRIITRRLYGRNLITSAWLSGGVLKEGSLFPSVCQVLYEVSSEGSDLELARRSVMVHWERRWSNNSVAS